MTDFSATIGNLAKIAKAAAAVNLHASPQQSSGEGDLFSDPGLEGSADGQGQPSLLGSIELSPNILLDAAKKEAIIPSKNPEEKDFLVNTGFEQDKPHIILSTEFLPLIGSIETSARDYALNVKEVAEVLTAKNAFEVLSGNEQTDKLIKENKDKLIAFAKDSSSKINAIIAALTSAISALNIKNHIKAEQTDKFLFSLPTNNGGNKKYSQTNLGIRQFKDYLPGWGLEASKLSPTALYQQYILELKRNLYTHTPKLLPGAIGTAKKLSDYESAYHLRGLFSISSQSGFGETLTLEIGDKKNKGVNSIEPLNKSDKDNDTLKLYNRLGLVRGKNISGDNPTFGVAQATSSTQLNEDNAEFDEDPFAEGVRSVVLANHIKIKILHNGKSGNTNYSFFLFADPDDSSPCYNYSTKQLVDDPVALAILLTNEINYSTFLSKSANLDLLTARGFQYSIVAPNSNILDYIIGNSLKRDVLDMSLLDSQVRTLNAANPDPTLLGLSRSKIQLGDDTANKYNVMTFETNNMPLVDDNFENLTHGSYFYIDSALSTVDFVNFDTSRLSSLLLDLEKSNESVLLLKRMYSGVPLAGDKDIFSLYEEKNSILEDLPSRLLKISSSIIDIYKKFANKSKSGEFVQVDATKRYETLYVKDQGVQPDALYLAAATIFKLSSSSNIRDTSDDKARKKKLVIKYVLFHILMRELRKTLESTYSPTYLSPTNSATSKTINVELDNGSETTVEPDVAIVVWEDASWNGAPVTSLSSIIESIVNSNGEYTPDVHSPEGLIDQLLISLYGHRELTTIEDSSQGFVLPIKEMANIGKGSITKLPQAEDPEMADAAVQAGTLYEDQVLNGFKSDLNSELGQGNGALGKGGKPYSVSEDQVTVGDDPTIMSVLFSAESYLGALGTGINSTESQGLFKEVVGILYDIVAQEIFHPLQGTVTRETQKKFTRYSYISSGEICWFVFSLLCEFIAGTLPDNPGGTFSTVSTSDPRIGGYLVKLDQSEVNRCFSVSGDEFTSKFVENFLNDYYSERTRIGNNISILDSFIKQNITQIKNYKDNLSKDFSSFLRDSQSVLLSDPNLRENPTRAVVLANMSFSREQLILSQHILSELIDRYDTTNQSESKLRTLPIFKNYSRPFMDYAPVNDLDLTSYKTLSAFFKSSEGFLKEKSNNARILSIGTPPRMIRNLIGEPTGLNNSNLENLRNNVIRIKVFKHDVLNPGIEFYPREFLFEVNRYPTRIVSNWNSLLPGTLDYRAVPTKFWDGNRMILHSNFDQAYGLYGNLLLDNNAPDKEIIRKLIYLNHVVSQVIEEYFTWFTGNRIDESRYISYGSGMSSVESQFLNNQVLQFNNFLKTTGNKFDLSSIYKLVPTNEQLQGKNAESIISGLESSVRRYLNNETLLMDINEHKKKIFYPKKFDRVFNVIFDPDDFIINTIDPKYIQKYIQSGLIKPDPKTGSYPFTWSRNTQQSDIYMEEYFVTIEPYDNVI